MGEIKKVIPVQLFVGVLTADAAYLKDVEAMLAKEFGPVLARSDIIPFDYTDYYAEQMGDDLERQFIYFQQLIDPSRLAEIKVRTNELEAVLAERYGRSAIPRPVNLDPGYLDLSKLVLATTKNYSHRIYLGQGIYAEVTLMYRADGYQALDWTYPDFRSSAYLDFFAQARDSYHTSLRELDS